jgi:hypothetical protein
MAIMALTSHLEVDLVFRATSRSRKIYNLPSPPVIVYQAISIPVCFLLLSAVYFTHLNYTLILFLTLTLRGNNKHNDVHSFCGGPSRHAPCGGRISRTQSSSNGTEPAGSSQFVPRWRFLSQCHLAPKCYQSVRSYVDRIIYGSWRFLFCRIRFRTQY